MFNFPEKLINQICLEQACTYDYIIHTFNLKGKYRICYTENDQNIYSEWNKDRQIIERLIEIANIEAGSIHSNLLGYYFLDEKIETLERIVEFSFLNTKIQLPESEFNILRVMLLQIEFATEIGLGPKYLELLSKYKIDLSDYLIEKIKRAITQFEYQKVEEFNEDIFGINPFTTRYANKKEIF